MSGRTLDVGVRIIIDATKSSSVLISGNCRSLSLCCLLSFKSKLDISVSLEVLSSLNSNGVESLLMVLLLIMIQHH